MEGMVAVLGNSDFVMPFSAMGLDTYPVGDGREEIIDSARKIVIGKYTLVIVAENSAAACDEVFATKDNAPVPCVVVVPFTAESTGFATEALGKVLKMATGINIFENN